MQTFFHINPGHTGYYFAVIAAGSLLGPLLLSRLFDTVGRKIMISSSYLLSGALLLGTAALFSRGSLTATTMTACLSGVLFFASAGASSAYLTVSEIFPLETRALAIAFFFAIGTAAGGIAGPLLYARLVGTGRVSDTALAFVIGGSVMMAAGLVEVVLGVRAEQRSLEDIAEPLTAQEVDQRRPPGTAGPQGTPSPA
jgi:MFS family permease